MKRDFDKILRAWMVSSERRPLLVRGARQVGKRFSIRTFGQENFEQVVEINFELQSTLKGIFEILDPSSIIKNLNLALGI